MWHAKGHSTKRGGNAGGGGGGGNGLVAVAIDKDKGSQSALRCAIENLHNKGHPIILIHVVHKSSASHGLNSEPTGKSNLENMTKSLFLTFHCYCTRKDVQCYDVILEDHDVAKAITEYVNYAAIEVLVLGAPSRHTFMRSPFARGGAGGPMNPRSFQEMLETDSEVSSFISSGRPSTERSPHTFNPAIDPFGFDSFVSNPRMSTSSDTSYASSVIPTPNKFVDLSSMQEFSFVSQDSARTSVSSQHNMAREMQRWKNEEEQKLEEAKNSEEAALSSIEEERARCKEAVETAEAAQKVAEMEAQKRMSLELKTIKDAGQLKKEMSNIDDQNDVRYRRYAMEDIEKATNKFDESKKIGEGGYGPVFKCYLDHTPVAVKVLRPDAVQGRSQFQREVEVLSMIRHPNMVLLLGACPEFGILVYEHMARGSLEDCLFRKNNVPPLSWQLRFKIAAEIATGLLFLHQTKPEPLVHRDLKPGNILLDINFVSKISDVGLARLVPAHVAENVTQQYHMTSAAGTIRLK
ncbi:U-box domain-containing protein 34 [Linum perenne]